MANLKSIAAALALAVLGSDAHAGDCTQPAAARQMVEGIASGLNQIRRDNGLSPIAFDRRLSQAAQVQACDVALTGQFGHRGSDGSNSHDRVIRAGFDSCLTAENLAWGYPNPGQILQGWMNSSGHRRNMLHSRVDTFGVGIANSASGPIWVLVVARDC